MSLPVLFYFVLELLLGPPIDVLIDPERGLPAWYDPGLQVDAVHAMDELQQAAFEAGLKLDVFSGYRSFENQVQVYAREQAVRGEDADFYSAPAGHSEHQLGTAFDVVWPGVVMGSPDPRNDMLYSWLEQNAHRFGFVISYPYKRFDAWPYSNRLMSDFTDFIYEPWHIRFVGVALATKIFGAGYLDPDVAILPQDFYQIWP